LSEALIGGRFTEASIVEVYLDGDSLQYRPVELEEMSEPLLVQ